MVQPVVVLVIVNIYISVQIAGQTKLNIPLPKTHYFVAWEKTEKVKKTSIKLQPVNL